MGRLENLKAKLAAREGKKEYAESNAAIRAEIARHENPTPHQPPASSTAIVRGAE